MTGWLIAGGILFLLAILPLGVRLRYNEQGFAMKILAGPFKIPFSIPKTKKSPKDTPEKGKKKPKESEKPKEDSQKGGSWKDFLPLISVGLDFLGDLRRKLRFDHINIHVVLAGEDPADLGILYGKIWAAVAGLWPALERAFVIRRKNVEITCDFAASETLVAAAGDVTLTLGRAVCLTVRYGVRALREYLKIRKSKDKAVQEHE